MAALYSSVAIVVCSHFASCGTLHALFYLVPVLWCFVIGCFVLEHKLLCLNINCV